MVEVDNLNAKLGGTSLRLNVMSLLGPLVSNSKVFLERTLLENENRHP
jgi:hypothetical protein